jgi:hypothetical protein
VKFFTEIRDQREQTISAERQLVLAGGPAALCNDFRRVANHAGIALVALLD